MDSLKTYIYIRPQPGVHLTRKNPPPALPQGFFPGLLLKASRKRRIMILNSYSKWARLNQSKKAVSAAKHAVSCLRSCVCACVRWARVQRLIGSGQGEYLDLLQKESCKQQHIGTSSGQFCLVYGEERERGGCCLLHIQPPTHSYLYDASAVQTNSIGLVPRSLPIRTFALPNTSQRETKPKGTPQGVS